MDEHANITLIRRAFEAFDAGDLEFVRNFFANDCIYHYRGQSSLAGDYVGRDQIMALFARIVHLTDSYTATPHDVLANDHHSIALVNIEAERRGEAISYDIVQIAHIEDGQVKEVWSISEDPYRTDPFWSD